MSSAVEKEWDQLTNSREKELAEKIDAMSARGMSAIQIASRLSLRITDVWNYLRTKSPETLRNVKSTFLK
jgi:hypothetical protein